jgi:hypothetical protein
MLTSHCASATAGHARHSSTLRLSGTVRYNGKSSDKFMLQRTAAYVAQTDYHVPALTVDETLSFAEACLVSPGPACAFVCCRVHARHWSRCLMPGSGHDV